MRQWIAAAGTVAVLFYVGTQVDRDYSQTVLGLGIAVLIYFGLLQLDAHYARAWLCMGAGLAAFFVCVWSADMIIALVLGRKNTLGVLILAAPVLLLVGGIGGFYLVYRWTDPESETKA